MLQFNVALLLLIHLLSFVNCYLFQASFILSRYRESTHSSSSSSSSSTALSISSQQLGEYTPISRNPNHRLPKLTIYDFTTNNHSSLVPYNVSLGIQNKLVDLHLKDRTDKTLDSLLIVTHPPLYTLGTGVENLANLLPTLNSSSSSNDRVEIIQTTRGGEITYHGPGQLVIYPILNLHNYKKDIHWYIRTLEQIVINSITSYLLQSSGNITCITNSLFNTNVPYKKDGITGVFLNQKKIASIGVKIRSGWITMHGIAINLTYESLKYFSGIKACGLEGVTAGCLEESLGLGGNLDGGNNNNHEGRLLINNFKSHLINEIEKVLMVDVIYGNVTTIVEK